MRNPTHGGALIGDGAFGCVYAPPLPCAKKAKPKSHPTSQPQSPTSKTVSKVFNDEHEMQTEWQMSKLISQTSDTLSMPPTTATSKRPTW